MSDLLQRYTEVVGEPVVMNLVQLGNKLRGKSVVHVNSTREGGGVAEILRSMVPLMNELGLDTHWKVIEGGADFFSCTKAFHNALQGNELDISSAMLDSYIDTNAENAELLRDLLQEADFVFIHDPQPAPLLSLCPQRKGKWIWRCHIDVSSPNRRVWRILRNYVSEYDASIFHLADFAQPLPHRQFLIPPSIDPLSEKNISLSDEEINTIVLHFGLDLHRPILLQVSRFDRFKDPLGVIRSYQMLKKEEDVQLVLAGGGASDDPESAVVLKQVTEAAQDDPDIHVVVLPPNAHRTINALQRGAYIVMQKSLKEGFGLTVAEAMWKHKPVIGGSVGGIRLQIINRFNGFKVNSPEGAVLRARYLLAHHHKNRHMGNNAHNYVRENFLITSHLRSLLALMLSVTADGGDDLEVFC